MLPYSNNNFRRVVVLTTTVLEHYLPNVHKVYSKEVKVFYAALHSTIQSRGPRFAIAWLKESRNCVLRVLTGRPLSEAGCVALKDGWPVWLLAFQPIARAGGDERRYLLTLLGSLRCFALKPILDLNPIISPYGGLPEVCTPEEYRRVVRRLGLRPRDVSWSNFHMTSSSGPMGHALFTSLAELTVLPSNLIADIKLLGGEQLSKAIDALIMHGIHTNEMVRAHFVGSPEGQTASSSYRKLFYFSDKEGKTRVVATLDYWSQTALRPLHKVLAHQLERLPGDCTFNQASFHRILAFPGPYFSIDLSNATDRMPLWLQTRLVSEFIGAVRAEAWARILVSHEYDIVGSRGKQRASYLTGQPMGAYSSWPSMALCHHFIVQLAAERAGVEQPYDRYALLGDDLVLCDERVALAYRDILRALDMPVSEPKTHVSADSFEFAKRWYIAKRECTGFSIGGLATTYKSYALVQGFLETQADHGWELNDEEASTFLVACYSRTKLPPRRSVVRLFKLLRKIRRAEKSEAFTRSSLGFAGLEPGSGAGWSDVLVEVIKLTRGSTADNLEKLLSNFSSPSTLCFAMMKVCYRRLSKDQLRRMTGDSVEVGIGLDKLNGKITAAARRARSVAPNFSFLNSSMPRSAWRDMLMDVPVAKVLARSLDTAYTSYKLPELVEDRSDLDSVANAGIFTTRSQKVKVLRGSMITKLLISVANEWLKDGTPVEENLRIAGSWASAEYLSAKDSLFGVGLPNQFPADEFWGPRGIVVPKSGSPPDPRILEVLYAQIDARWRRVSVLDDTLVGPPPNGGGSS